MAQKKERGNFKKNKANGEKNINSKLTVDKFLQIRAYYKANSYNQYELAKMYEVTQPTIGCIVINETWRHIL